MDYGCSNNFRVYVCSLYLPRYDPVTQTTAGPCRETCNRARSRCRRMMKQSGSRWPRNFKYLNSSSLHLSLSPPSLSIYLSEVTYCHFGFGPTPWGPQEFSKGQISFNFNYKVNLKDFYTKLCMCSHK